MLPDLPKIKNELYQGQLLFIKWAQRAQMPVFKASIVSILYEGDIHEVKRSPGEVQSNPLRKISGNIIFEPGNDDLGATFSKIYELAGQMAKQFEKNSFEMLHTELTKAEQVVSHDGTNVLDAILKSFEKIEISLDKDGKFDLSKHQIVVGTDLYNKINKQMLDPETNTIFKQKLEDTLKNKKEEAHVREANRRLVG